jgi:hypothetical protein
MLIAKHNIYDSEIWQYGLAQFAKNTKKARVAHAPFFRPHFIRFINLCNYWVQIPRVEFTSVNNLYLVSTITTYSFEAIGSKSEKWYSSKGLFSSAFQEAVSYVSQPRI